MDAHGNLEWSVVTNSLLREKLRDVVADGGEFNIICQNALSSSAISLKYEKTSILLLYTSQVKLLFLLLRNTQNTCL